VILN